MVRIQPFDATRVDYASFTSGAGTNVYVVNNTDSWRYIGGTRNYANTLSVRGNVDWPITGYSVVGHIYLYSNQTFVTVTPTSTATSTATFTPTSTPTLTPTSMATSTATVTPTPNRSGSGTCWNSGASWPDYYANYTIDSTTIPATDWVNSINSAANTWTNVTPSHFVFNNLAGTNNVISEGSLADPDQLALTSVYATSTTPITKVITVFSDTKPFDTGNPPTSGNYSVENVMTHEFGHWLYLVDNYDEPNCGEVTMYGYISTGETKKTSLESADENAINWQYP